MCGSDAPPRLGRMNTHLRRLLVVLAATAVAVALWVAAVPVAGVDLTVGATAVGLVPVVLACLVAGLAGWGLRAVLERVTARGGRAWVVIACVVLAVSCAGPLGAGSAAAVLVLLGMHVLVGGILLAGLARR